MNKKMLVVGSAALLGSAGMSAQAAVLGTGDLLTVGAGSWFAVDMDANLSIDASEMAAIAPGSDGGMRIGSTQAIGAIDAWTWLGQPGNHYTTVAPTGSTTGGIDFAGWTIHWNGYDIAPAIDLGAWTPANCATLGCAGVSFVADVAAFSWSGVYGDSYSLWYSWSFLESPGIFESTDYVLHLEGTVQAAPAVPVPAAAWLFGSGLLGLLGFMKRKVA